MLEAQGPEKDSAPTSGGTIILTDKDNLFV